MFCENNACKLLNGVLFYQQKAILHESYYSEVTLDCQQLSRKDGKKMKTTESISKSDAPFMKIGDASKATGLSMYFLRQGCRDNTVPHIRSGQTYLVNVPKLLARLDAESAR